MSGIKLSDYIQDTSEAFTESDIATIKKQFLYNTVMQFVEDQDITCEETIHQMDSVIENAYDFISDLFNIVKDDLDLEEED